MSDRIFPINLPHDPTRGSGSPGLAQGHSRTRLLNACEMICWVGRLAMRPNTPSAPVFTIVKANLQDATAGPERHAAHILPGQILINGSPPSKLDGGDIEKAGWAARFMVTSPVPPSVNKADSAAEAAGLKEAFRHACEVAWTRVKSNGRDLTSTYETFLRDADRAFIRAGLAKEEKHLSASSGGDSSAAFKRAEERIVLLLFRSHAVTAEEANLRFPLIDGKTL